MSELQARIEHCLPTEAYFLPSANDDRIALSHLAWRFVGEKGLTKVPDLTTDNTKLAVDEHVVGTGNTVTEQFLQKFEYWSNDLVMYLEINTEPMNELRSEQRENVLAKVGIKLGLGPWEIRPAEREGAESGRALGMSDRERESVIDGSKANFLSGHVSDKQIVHVSVCVPNDVVDDAHLLEQQLELGLFIFIQQILVVVPASEHRVSAFISVDVKLEAAFFRTNVVVAEEARVEERRRG